MKKAGSLFHILSIATVVLAAAILVDAQATRTWVSGVGDDVNPCSRTAPCKTFAGAISKTAKNGEINCLDPGGYGAVTITKSITIDCVGTFGSILSAGVTAVTVNITDAADVEKAVKLRGIAIQGATTGIHGVRILAAKAVHLDKMLIDNVSQHGVSVEFSGGTALRLYVSETKIRNNGGHGINFFNSGAGSSLHIADSYIVDNTQNGVNLASTTESSIFGTQITGNATGIVIATVAAAGDVAVMNCLISGNTTGISAGTGATIRISGNMISGNVTGIAAGGSIISSGNNAINGNTTNGAPTSTIATQ